MSNDIPDIVNELIMRGQLDADTLRKRAEETNCNGLVTLSYLELSYHANAMTLWLVAIITPNNLGSFITSLAIDMLSPDQSNRYGAALTILSKGGSPTGAPGATLYPYLIAQTTQPAPGTQILGRVYGSLQTPPSFSCDFYFEKVFEINSGD